MAELTSRLSQVREVVSDQGWSVAATRSRRFFGRAVRGALERARDAQVDLLDASVGAQRANTYFWKGLARRPGWSNVQSRLEALSGNSAADIEHFVRVSLERNDDPMVVLGLARHPLSHRVTESWLRRAWASEREDLATRLQSNRLLGAAVVAAAELLVEPSLAGQVTDWAETQYGFADKRFQQFVDSTGWSVSMGRRISNRTCRKRLIITEHFGDTESIALQFLQADRVSVIATSDTFGRADFTGYRDYPDVGTIEVEHIRTRIPRFSQAYVDLHEATAEVARTATRRMLEFPGLIAPDIQPYVEVGVADFLFFQALKLRAIAELLADETIDDIVVAIGNQDVGTEFLRLLSSVEGLFDDQRVRIASIARSGRERGQFWAILDEISTESPQELPSTRRLPDDAVLKALTREIDDLASGLELPALAKLPGALFVTSASSAYLDSTIGYAAAIRNITDVHVLCLGGDHQLLDEHLRGAEVSGFEVLSPAGPRFDSLAETLQPVLSAPLRDPTTPAEVAAASALQLSAHRLGREVVGPAVASAQALDRWLVRCREEQRLPGVILLSPQRNVWVAAAAAIARRFGIPSISLEAHAHDANYSRYVKVGADYYAVISEYFRDQVAEPFGIGLDRVSVVGSPRQIVPADYDPIAARAAVIAALPPESRLTDDRLRLVFFCQPSAWTHVDKIWTTLLLAAEDQDCLVILKTHPEETATRAQKYLDRADDLGLRSRVIEFDAGPDDAIALADIAVTAYSAAAFDAVLRRRPVIALTDGDLEYPVDLAAILGVPLARSVDDLCALITEFRADAFCFQARIEEFLEGESQFIDGPGPRLRQLVLEVLEAGSSGIRRDAELPGRMFLDGPHPTFPV